MAKNKGGTESLKRKIMAFDAVKKELPKEIAYVCQTFFRDSFKKQGWDNVGISKWQPRTTVYKKKSKNSKPILVQTGDLRRSIQIDSITFKKIRLISSLPYSAIHNDGGVGLAWGKHPFKMPQRKFMGHSKRLNVIIKKRINEEMGFKFMKA